MDRGRADKRGCSLRPCPPTHRIAGAGTSRRRRATASPREWARFVAACFGPLQKTRLPCTRAPRNTGQHLCAPARPATNPRSSWCQTYRGGTWQGVESSLKRTKARKREATKKKEKRRAEVRRSAGAAVEWGCARAQGSNQVSLRCVACCAQWYRRPPIHPGTPLPPCPACQLGAELQRRGVIPQAHVASYVKSAWFRVQDTKPISAWERADDGYAPEVLAKAADEARRAVEGAGGCRGGLRCPRGSLGPCAAIPWLVAISFLCR
jgi:hypothetical protein